MINGNNLLYNISLSVQTDRHAISRRTVFFTSVSQIPNRNPKTLGCERDRRFETRRH